MTARSTPTTRSQAREPQIQREPGFFCGWRVVCARHTMFVTPGHRWAVRPLSMASDLTQLRERAA